MICITVTPKSRTLAKADLLNAARQGDIIELCLDHFHKEPDVKDLITAVDKPLIVSCRRPVDGGMWQGTEEERLMLLRQAIVASPDYVELDLDVAPNVPRFGKTQRVISFTRLDRPESDIDSIFSEAMQAKADVVKFCWPTPTLNAAWPLLAAVSQKRMLPVVGMGLGRAELTFSLLGRKFGSPWIYAALEKGMEAHPGQATVFELNDIYDLRSINPKTVFVAVTGFGEAQTRTVRILNAAFQEANLNVRCLPVEFGDIQPVKKMLEALKIRAVVVHGRTGASLAEWGISVSQEDAATGYLDLLLNKSEGWQGFNFLGKAALKGLSDHLQTSGGDLARMNVLVIGNGGMAQTLTRALVRKNGMVSVCGPDDKDARRVASDVGCRFVPYQNLYETLMDAVIVADPKVEPGTGHKQVNPSLLRPGMLFLDISNLPVETTMLSEARDRGCHVVDSTKIFADQVAAQYQAISGKPLSESALARGLSDEP